MTKRNRPIKLAIIFAEIYVSTDERYYPGDVFFRFSDGAGIYIARPDDITVIYSSHHDVIATALGTPRDKTRTALVLDSVIIDAPSLDVMNDWRQMIRQVRSIVLWPPIQDVKPSSE